MISVAFGEAGFRQITNSRREIRKPEDLKGLKIRVLGTCPMFFDLYGQLGADPTAMNGEPCLFVSVSDDVRIFPAL